MEVQRTQFGKDWYKINQPVEAIITSINLEEFSPAFNLIGLSPMQMENLGIERGGLNIKDLEDIKDGKGILLKGSYSENLIVDFNGNRETAGIYNDCTISIGNEPDKLDEFIVDNGIQISSKLARILGLKVGDKIKLSTKKEYFTNPLIIIYQEPEYTLIEI